MLKTCYTTPDFSANDIANDIANDCSVFSAKMCI